MAYAVTNPPKLLVSALAGTGASLWTYSSTDGATDVDASGYITNAKGLGMRAGDIVFVLDSNASPLAQTIHVVSAINANGSADLSTGVDVGSTNGD